MACRSFSNGEREAAFRFVRVDGQGVPMHMVGSGRQRLQANAHASAAYGSASLIDAATGAANLDATEGLLQLLRERERDLAWGFAHGTADGGARALKLRVREGGTGTREQ